MYAQGYTHTYIQHKVYIAELIADCGNHEFVTCDPSLAGLEQLGIRVHEAV